MLYENKKTLSGYMCGCLFVKGVLLIEGCAYLPDIQNNSVECYLNCVTHKAICIVFVKCLTCPRKKALVKVQIDCNDDCVCVK